jgi:hypothetical protein
VFRPEDGKVESYGGRKFISIPLDYEFVASGWWTFAFIAKVLRNLELRADQLEWMYTEENRGFLKAVFEVHHV